MNLFSSSGVFLRKSATWKKKLCSSFAASSGIFASCMASSMIFIHRSLARKFISNGECLILSLGWPLFSRYVVSAPMRNSRKSLSRSSAPWRSSFGYIGPSMSSVGIFL